MMLESDQEPVRAISVPLTSGPRFVPLEKSIRLIADFLRDYEVPL